MSDWLSNSAGEHIPDLLQVQPCNARRYVLVHKHADVIRGVTAILDELCAYVEAYALASPHFCTTHSVMWTALMISTLPEFMSSDRLLHAIAGRTRTLHVIP